VKPYSVVILSKTVENLKVCLAAIGRNNTVCRVIVVDDGLAERLQSLNYWPEYVDGAKPFIFAQNANIGIAAAGEDDVILLNDDALLKTRDGFNELSYMAQSRPEYGIISPATSGVGNENQSLYANGGWEWERTSSGHGLRDEPKVLCFVCVYIRRDVLNKLGPLDERFRAYGWEDNDYCRRALADGYKLGIYDPVQVEHGTLKSTFRGFGHCDITFNQRLYEEKWGKPPLTIRADSE
jgi:GT2 family glycosyltransferase